MRCRLIRRFTEAETRYLPAPALSDSWHDAHAINDALDAAGTHADNVLGVYTLLQHWQGFNPGAVVVALMRGLVLMAQSCDETKPRPKTDTQEN
jgi:hypothetical protein